VSLAPTARVRRFHELGPWVLAGGAVAAALVVEALRHHVVGEEQLLYFAVIVPTIVLHEVSHGVVAKLCGDTTAAEAGRLTLNPLKHIDLIGTVILPILLIISGGPAFGWAKPVPVSVGRLRHPRNQAVLVGLAGPATNVVLALGFGYLFRLASANGARLPLFGAGPVSGWPILDQLLYLAGFANVIVAAFNLIPIPPLDGAAVVERFLPRRVLPQYYRLRSFFMLFVLLFVFVAPGLLDTLFQKALTLWGDVVFA